MNGGQINCLKFHCPAGLPQLPADSGGAGAASVETSAAIWDGSSHIETHEQLETEQGEGRKPVLRALAGKSSVSLSKCCCCWAQGSQLSCGIPALLLGERVRCPLALCPTKGAAVTQNCILSIPTWTKGSLVTYLLHPALPQSC